MPIATGDTKVVERGKADGLYVTTAGIGLVASGVELGPERVRPGDRVLVSGTIGDHGMAVMVARGELELEVDLESDTAPVHELALALLALGGALRWMRDPTRGGLATALNELAQAGGASRSSLDEAALPLRPAVDRRVRDPRHRPALRRERGAAWSPSSPPTRPTQALAAPAVAARSAPRRRSSATVRAEPEGLVLLDTSLGGSRIVDMLVGDPLPRIC